MQMQEAVMTTQDVANRFHQLALTGNWDQIQNELFDHAAVSLEPDHTPGMNRVEGMDAIKQKLLQFEAMTEQVHGGFTSAPIVAGNHFAVAINLDATMKERGRVKMDEIAVYEVKNGKIVKEQFFY